MNITETPIIFESHITTDPVFGKELEELSLIVEEHGFKMAKLLMQKRLEDTPLLNSKDSFCTGHSKNYYELKTNMADLVNALRRNGFKVLRYKIENVVLDSKHKDELELLNHEACAV